MEQIALRIGDKIHGKVLDQIHSGCAGDEYFSIENVSLDTGVTIRVFFQERGSRYRPEFGEEFTGTVGCSMTGPEPFTTKSIFMIDDMAPYRELAPVAAVTAPVRRSPIAWLGQVCRKAFRCET